MTEEKSIFLSPDNLGAALNDVVRELVQDNADPRILRAEVDIEAFDLLVTSFVVDALALLLDDTAREGTSPYGGCPPHQSGQRLTVDNLPESLEKQLILPFPGHLVPRKKQ